MIFNWTDGPLAEGLSCYHRGEYFAAHEHWERVWLHAPQPEKRFLQALIQISVALHHHSRGNQLGASRLLSAALGKLDAYPHPYASVAVNQLRNDIRSCLHALAEPTPATPAAPLAAPGIHPL